MKLKRLLFLMPLSVMAIIFYFSSQNAVVSTYVSDGLIEKIAEFIIELFNLENIDTFIITDNLRFIVRKTAHIFLYTSLGASFYLSYFFNIKYKPVVISFISCFIYSCTDEIHQSFVPGRSGNIFDICVDSTGAIFGIFVIFFILKRIVILQTHHK